MYDNSSAKSLHKQQLYLLEQHGESLTIWSAVIGINSKGKSLIKKLGPERNKDRSQCVARAHDHDRKTKFVVKAHDHDLTTGFSSPY